MTVGTSALRHAGALALALCTLAFWAAPALAVDGELETSFSGDGQQTVPSGATSDIAPLSGGRTVAVGDGFSGGDQVVVLKADGSADTSFSFNGFASLPTTMFAEDVAVQPDGAIVVAGHAAGSITNVARLTPAGLPDPSFGGGDGFVTVNFAAAGNDRVADVAVGPDGEIVVVGTHDLGAGQRFFSIARLTPAGVPDTGFSGDGRAEFDLDPNDVSSLNYATSVDIQDDGAIVVAGAADVADLSDSTVSDNDNAEEFSFVVIRLTTAGALDTTFASGTGKSFPNVVTGAVDCDAVFGNDVQCSRELEAAEDVEVQDDGKIVVGGWTDSNAAADVDHDGDPDLGQDSQEIDYALVRLTSVGGIDSSFGGGDGRVTTPVSANTGTPSPGDTSDDIDRALNVEIQEDGKILASGSARSAATTHDFSIARYTASGTLDSTFDGDGGSGNGKLVFVLNPAAGSIDTATGLALFPDGTAILGGSVSGSGSGFVALKTDGTEPATLIVTGPAEGSTTTDNTPTYTFITGVAEPAGFAFQCRYSGVHSAFAACSSPYTKALSDGVHTFDVRAIDFAGNVDSTPETRTFTVDADPPQTTLTGNPGVFTADATPTFSFTSAPGGATFECALISGHGLETIEDTDFGSCSGAGTHTPASLPDDEYTFAARAESAAGADPSPATFEFVIDTDAPDGVIVQAPSGTISDHNPEFEVSTDEPEDIAGGEFTMTCELTGALPQSTPCTDAPFSFAQSLPDGSYTFTLEVTDVLARSDATPATASFTVATPPPPPPPPPPPSGSDGGGQAQAQPPAAPRTCRKGFKLKKGKCKRKKRRKR